MDPKVLMPDGKTPLVLIVEDDPALWKLYDEKFKKEGFETIVARDGEAGLQMAQTKKPNFMLLDMLLPKMKGIDVLAKLMENPDNKSISVVILTNVTEREEADKALSLGAKEYLAKAMHSPEDIVQRAKKHLGITA